MKSKRRNGIEENGGINKSHEKQIMKINGENRRGVMAMKNESHEMKCQRNGENNENNRQWRNENINGGNSELMK